MNTLDYSNLKKEYSKKNSLMHLKLMKVLNLIPDTGKLLDFGCGSGDLILEAAYKSPNLECFGMDIQDEALNFLKNRLIKDQRNIYIAKTTDKLHFQENFFDCVTCLDVLEHCKNPDETLKELNRVLKPGAKLIITVPNWFDIISVRFLKHSPEHIHTNTPYKWIKIIRSCGFKVHNFSTIKFPLLDFDCFNRYLPLFGMCVLIQAEKNV